MSNTSPRRAAQPRRLDFDDVLGALQDATPRTKLLRFVADQIDDSFDLTGLIYTRAWLRAQLLDLADLLEVS